MVRNSEYVRAYAGRYRDMFPVRIASIVGIVGIALWLMPWTWAAGFAVCQLSLYGVLWLVVERARLRPDAPGAGVILTRSSELLTLLLALHTSLFVLAVAILQPDYAKQAVLLIIGNLMVGALQVHISRLSFAAAVTPPAVTFAYMAWRAEPWDAVMLVSIALFIAGVVGAAWRQMTTDRQTVNLFVDLTRRRRELETALIDAEAQRSQAERANQAKSRFLAMISHDVRTPLNVILGITEVLKRGRRPTAEAELVADMGDAGGMLLRLLNGALDLSKIESGQADVRLAPVDVRAVVEGVGRVWRLRAEELGLGLEVACDGAEEDFRLLTDEARIEQVVINFLSNALKMTPAGALRIQARARPADDGAVVLDVEVHDQGPGVAEDQRERIFQPFEQLDDGRAAGGAGLGLAICRASVEALGGEIGVRPAEGGGSVFWFRITTARAVMPALAATPQASAEDGRLSILAAEDHPANRKLLTLLLEQFGIDLTLAENGAQAVEITARRDFDLILMDAMMPVLDGVGALTAIRAAETDGRPRTPIHMLTANVFEEDVARYLAAGADGVLRKPIEVAALHAVLTEAGLAKQAAPALSAVG